MNEYLLSEIRVGMTESFQREITLEMENSFRKITGDENPLHKDDFFSREISSEKMRSHVAFGMLTASLYSTMAGMYLPGKYSLIHSFDELSFMKPVYVGDTVTVIGEVVDKNEPLRLIMLKVAIRNQDNKIVSKAKMKVLVMK